MEESLYHYTSLEALEKILRPNKVSFLATHFNYMNDPTEYKWGQKLIEKGIPNYKPLNNDYYVISFSQKKDYLPMWSTYCDCSGVMIELDKNKINKKTRNAASCSYINKVTLNQLGAPELNICIETEDPKYYVDFGCMSIKNPSYEYEKEVRIILLKKPSDKIEFKTKNNLLKPCIKRMFNKELIKSITLSPLLSNDKERIINSLNMLFKERGYEHLIGKIYCSEIPFRL